MILTGIAYTWYLFLGRRLHFSSGKTVGLGIPGPEISQNKKPKLLTFYRPEGLHGLKMFGQYELKFKLLDGLNFRVRFSIISCDPY